jgi:small subunit ribosomal protein S2e
MGWFTNLVVVMACVAGGLVLYPVQITDAGKGEQAGVTLSGIVRLVHLLSFATAFGMSLWVSFIGGIIMFKNLPRHQFGNLQAKMFPAYFKLLMVCCSFCVSAMATTHPWNVATRRERLQIVSLGVSLFTVVANLLVFQPLTAKIMKQRHRIEKEEEKWVPCTKLGRLVQQGKIKSLEQIYLFSMPVKEYQIVEYFLGSALKDEVMKIMPVQKQTRAGQRTRFKAFVVVGDSNGHVGLGVKCAKEVATAIRGAIIQAKMQTIPVRRGYWGNKIGKPHTVPTKVTGKCGSVTVRLIPAPRGAGIVAARVPKKVLQMAGIEDCYTASRGSSKTLGNFVKATFYALQHTYGFLSPELWRETKYTKPPVQEFTDFLAKPIIGEAKPAAELAY